MMKQFRVSVRMLLLLVALAGVVLAWRLVAFDANRPDNLRAELQKLLEEDRKIWPTSTTDAEIAEWEARREAKIKQIKNELYEIGERARRFNK